MEEFECSDAEAVARQWLKRAYVLLEAGKLEEALSACETATERADDPVVPQSIHGAMLTASGRPVEAMRLLMQVHRRNRDAILPVLYLAEACFLAGRHRRAWKMLDSVDAEELAESPWGEFARQLRQTWEELGELGDIPQPKTIPIGDDATEGK